MSQAQPVRYLDAYIRVSRVGKRRGPSFISPLVQREAIEAWARHQRVELLEVFEEFDESGARRDRPLLQRVLERVEHHVSTGIVVWRVDRFGRSLADGVRNIERIRAAGGAFYSVGDGLDINSPAGRLVLGILLSVAEYQLDGIRDSWDAAAERAIRRGIHVEPLVPVGYRKTRTGRLKPHAVNGPILTELYELRASGGSQRSCAGFLEQHGVLTGKGNRGWNHTTLAYMLRSPVYLGQVRWGPYVNEQAHTPLTDPVTFEAAQQPRDVRRRPQNPQRALLSGLVRCAACSHKMPPATSHRTCGSYVLYKCGKFHAGGLCPSPACISDTKLDPFVTEAMFAVLSRRRRPPESKLAAADAKATQAVDALRRYRDNDHIALRIGDEAYLAGLAIRQRKLSVANLAVHDLRGQARASEFPPVPDLRRTARELGVEELRELVAQVIDVVFVSAGSGSTAQRATVCPAGTAPRVLPRAGDKGRAMNAIAPRRRWINADTAAAYAIEDRIQKSTYGLSRAELAARINAERCQGLSLRDIARNLDRDGVPAPRGGAWLPSTVSRMLPATASIANAASSAHPSH